MIPDKEWLFTGTAASPGQVVTADAGSTNYLDTGPLFAGNTGIDWGAPHIPLEFYVICTVADADADATVLVKIQTDDNTSFSSATDLYSFTIFSAPVAVGSRRTTVDVGWAWERYVRLFFDVTNAGLTTATFVGAAAPLGTRSVAKSFAIGSNFA